MSRKFELFEGVFGASDVALEILESGISFERMILDIYQSCSSAPEFKQAFDKLERKLEAKRDKKASQLRTLLLTESSDSKEAALDQTKEEIDHYLRDEVYWADVAEPDIGGDTQFWRTDHWGDECFGAHGTLFIGAFCNGGKMLFPVTLLCDENGRYIDFSEDDIVGALERSDDSDIHYFTPTSEENTFFSKIYSRLTEEMLSRYSASVDPIKAYNKHKVENWAEIQTEQLNFEIEDLAAEIRELNLQSAAAKDFLEKVDIRKKADEKRKHLQRLQESFHQKVSAIQAEAEAEIAAFNKKLEIEPILWISVVLKF